MASSSALHLDSPITLKVNYEGDTRRFKLPLRDLSVNTLEAKLRSAMAIPQDTECIFERYSDSVGNYVVLDQGNPSVYKQLYRAAKAKQKLRLRITAMQQEHKPEEKKGPLPASVEDEPESAAPAQLVDVSVDVEPVVAPSPPAPMCEPRSDKLQALYWNPSANTTPPKSIPLIEQDQEKLERRFETIKASIIALQERATQRASQGLESLLESDVGNAPTKEATLEGSIAQPATSPNYAVYCNHCDKATRDVHYHCSTCDDGDFDLCQDCVDRGITCRGFGHWLLKRFVRNGIVVNSTTETVALKPKVPKPKPQEAPAPVAPAAPIAPVASYGHPARSVGRTIPVVEVAVPSSLVRTCNSCVRDFPDREFVHCTTCEDFDLCKKCFSQDKHGHHPNHGFVAVVEGSKLEPEVSQRLAPGRNQRHNAICDGCEDDIRGVRHKCLDCPDWDYCSKCVADAGFIHPNHRFVPIYGPLAPCPNLYSMHTHIGIYCDGPLCRIGAMGSSSYIVGDRYKCAVCHDTDFCAACEASPANTHNRTHPLIKFKTPIKEVTVSTTGTTGLGKPMVPMGDLVEYGETTTTSRATETTTVPQEIFQTNVVTVADIQPSETTTSATPVEVKNEEVKQEQPSIAQKQPADSEDKAVKKLVPEKDLVAVFEGDTVADGTIFPTNHVFEQTWVIRNNGDVPFPPGCSVRYVGGDYMGYLDRNRPAGVAEIAAAGGTNACLEGLAPKEDFSFTVTLRTPLREGKYISFWRLSTDEGIKFGPRLWCDIVVQEPKVTKETEKLVKEPSPESTVKPEESQMIFPKLEKESPSASTPEIQQHLESTSQDEDYDRYYERVEWTEEESDNGVLTDEEYDILDASDEEYFEDQKRQSK